MNANLHSQSPNVAFLRAGVLLSLLCACAAGSPPAPDRARDQTMVSKQATKESQVGTDEDMLIELPNGTMLERIPDGTAEVMIVDDASRHRGTIASSHAVEAIVYKNDYDSGFAIFLNHAATDGAAFPGVFVADEMTLDDAFIRGPNGDRITSYELTVFRSFLDPNVGVLADVNVELWDGDPLGQLDTAGVGFVGGPIANSSCSFSGIAVNTVALLRCELPSPVTVNNPAGRVWMVMTSNACRIGWRISSRVPTIGSVSPDDHFEMQSDVDGETNGLGTCCQDGSSCQFGTATECLDDRRSGTETALGFCSDGFAENAEVKTFGGPCNGDFNGSDFCSTFMASIFTTAKSRVSFTPTSATGLHFINGNTITMTPGNTVFLEVRLGGWGTAGDGTRLLKAWIVNLDSAGYASGLNGTLGLLSRGCAANSDCLDIFGGTCSLTGVHCTQASDCPAPAVESCDSLSLCGSAPGYSGAIPDGCLPIVFDTSRADYVFSGEVEFPAVDLSTPDFRAASVVFAVPGVSDPGREAYALSVAIDVPPDARGSFTLDFFGPQQTNMIDQDNTPIGPLGITPATIIVATDPLANVQKNRYLTIEPPNSSVLSAVRVTFVDLPIGMRDQIGTSMWLRTPFEVSTNGHTSQPVEGFPNFLVSRLGCDPSFEDWTSHGVVQVADSHVVPGAVYGVDYFEGINPLVPLGGSGTSTFIATGKWGDAVGPFDPEQRRWLPPDGSVDIVTDLIAMIETFASAGTMPSKTRTDIAPMTPDGQIDIFDLVFGIEAFRGKPYPFIPGPVVCP